MKPDYSDILNRLGAPVWWDEAGVPRYEEFSPEKTVRLGSDRAALLEIACQGCGEVFIVATSSNKESFNEKAKLGKLGYGDPPVTSCCTIGPTMNSIPVKIIEFWQKDDRSWERRRDLEGPIECVWAGDVKYRKDDCDPAKSHEFIQRLISKSGR